MKPIPLLLCLFALFAGCARSAQPLEETASACAALVGRSLANGSVKEATFTAAGQSLSLAGAKEEVKAPFGFCRTKLALQSEPGSEIQTEVWMPVKANWNGKFVGLGNGGFGGVILESHLFGTMRHGFAVAMTDMGHGASFPKTLAPMNAKWAYKSPIKVADWAHRANHLTALAGKELLNLYQGQWPKRAYFHGCSDGGREALMQAGRYPEDYDGIVAGAPAAAFTDLMAEAQWNARQAAPTNLVEEKLDRLHKTVVAHCDALDGAKDGLIENPSVCKFDPEVLLCKSGEAVERCLSKV